MCWGAKREIGDADRAPPSGARKLRTGHVARNQPEIHKQGFSRHSGPWQRVVERLYTAARRADQAELEPRCGHAHRGALRSPWTGLSKHQKPRTSAAALKVTTTARNDDDRFLGRRASTARCTSHGLLSARSSARTASRRPLRSSRPRRRPFTAPSARPAASIPRGLIITRVDVEPVAPQPKRTSMPPAHAMPPLVLTPAEQERLVSTMSQVRR